MQCIARRLAVLLLFSCAALQLARAAPMDNPGSANLIVNPDFTARAGATPAAYELAGDLHYRDLAGRTTGTAGWGVAFQSAQDINHEGAIAGSVSQRVTGIDSARGRWFRFSFRGLPEPGFLTAKDGLWMKVEYFNGAAPADGKIKRLDSLLQRARRDLSANGDRHVNGAAVWRTYALDFWLPFPTVNALRLSVGFDHGQGSRAEASEFLVTDFSLTRIEGPASGAASAPAATAAAQRPEGNLIPIGGRWFYRAKDGETSVPALFTATNADRLYYHDAQWTTPFAGSMTSWLRAGDKDIHGIIVTQDRFIPDNVTVSFDASAMIIHTRGLPNHPTGQFPQTSAGPDGRGRGNPNYITEQRATYYIPLNPAENPHHVVTTADNSNHALPMGPIGIAANGIVFFNPFDAGSMDASNLMDMCCGHPNQDGLYHYHKYPICMNSPWADEGNAHSPLIGWAFDGYPIYGPYESAGVMAKDVTGEHALNGFNMDYDQDRGWHYHVTPGKFPYIIGGYWGTEDPRDRQHPHHPGGPGGEQRDGRRGPPPGAPPWLPDDGPPSP